MSWFKPPKYKRNITDIEKASDVITLQSHIRVYDDATGKDLTPREIRMLEEMAEKTPVPLLVDQDETDRILTPSEHQEAHKKYKERKEREARKQRKSRLQISSRLRQFILLRSNGMCEYCNKRRGKHIHHINGMPDQNYKNNLMFVCEICHTILHREMKNSNGEVIDQLISKIAEKNKTGPFNDEF